jgi:hypothetical protein
VGNLQQSQDKNFKKQLTFAGQEISPDSSTNMTPCPLKGIIKHILTLFLNPVRVGNLGKDADTDTT